VKKILISGVRGIGKSTLINKIQNKISESFVIFQYSQILQKVVGIERFKTFDRLSEKKKNNYRRLVIAELESIEKRENKHILVEGHTSLYNPKTENVESTMSAEDILYFNEIILCELNVNQILKRRQNDLSKKRELSLEVIQSEQDMEKKIALEWAKLTRNKFNTVQISNEMNPEKNLLNLLLNRF